MAETFTGTVYKPQTNQPWAAAAVTIQAVSDFVNGIISYPSSIVELTTDEDGEFSTELSVPASGSATYRVFLPNGEDYLFYIADGDGPITLAQVMAGYGSPVDTDTLAQILGNYLLLTGGTLSGQLNFSGTDHAGIKLISLTTAERDALTPAEGMVIYNDTTNQVQVYQGGAWVSVGAGATPSLDDITNVTITGTPADKELLAFDTGSVEWINQTAAEAGLATSGHNHTGTYDPAGSAAAAQSAAQSYADSAVGTHEADTSVHGIADTSLLLDTADIGSTVASQSHTHTENETIIIACSDETTALTAGTAKVTFRMPYAMTLTAVRASVNTAPTGSTLVVDINEGGVSILSTKLSIDATEKTSTTADVPAVISDSALADDAEMTIDIDAVGSSVAGKGLKVTLIGTRT